MVNNHYKYNDYVVTQINTIKINQRSGCIYKLYIKIDQSTLRKFLPKFQRQFILFSHANGCVNSFKSMSCQTTPLSSSAEAASCISIIKPQSGYADNYEGKCFVSNSNRILNIIRLRMHACRFHLKLSTISIWVRWMMNITCVMCRLSAMRARQANRATQRRQQQTYFITELSPNVSQSLVRTPTSIFI